MNCLESFRYDDISIDLLIKMGMVSVLIEVLDDKTKVLPDGHKISWKYKKNDKVTMANAKKKLKLDLNQLVENNYIICLCILSIIEHLYFYNFCIG